MLGFTRCLQVQVDHTNRLMRDYDGDELALHMHIWNPFAGPVPDDLRAAGTGGGVMGRFTTLAAFGGGDGDGDGDDDDDDSDSDDSDSDPDEDAAARQAREQRRVDRANRRMRRQWRRTGTFFGDLDNSRSLPESPWPELARQSAYGVLRELAILVLTHALEEVAVRCLSERACDKLTKNTYDSAGRKQARSGRLVAAARSVKTAFRSSALRWASVYLIDTTLYVCSRLKMAWRARAQAAAAAAAEAKGERPALSLSGVGAAPLVARSWYVHLPRQLLINSGFWGAESLAVGVAQLVNPMEFGSAVHRHVWQVTQQLCFSAMAPSVDRWVGSVLP